MTKQKKDAVRHTKKSYSRDAGFFSRSIKTVLIVLLFGCIGIIGYGGWISRDLPNPNQLLDRALPVSTKIYARDGEHLLYEIHGAEQRTLVTIDMIPEYVKWATITVEDKNFYTHKGFDIKSIFRAIIIDIIRRGKAQGGSTITQQFIKNALLSNEKKLSRKLKELILAYQIEKKFSKDEILQLYFNEIPYGSTAYGIQAASKTYFGKDIGQLSIAEGAVLAALPKAPTYYSPWGSNKDKLLTRQKKILDDMAVEGHITQEEAQLAKQETIVFRELGDGIIAPHFVFYVKELLTDIYGEKVVEQGGLSVITTLDITKQRVAQEVVKKWGEKNISMNASNAALLSMDPKNGDILAMVGSRDYFNKDIDGNVNVTVKKRQPGSSFKPIVYAAAFNKGYTPKTIIFDIVTNFDTTALKPYIPHNYTSKEYGPVSLRQALAGSLNITAVKVLYLTGVRTVIEFAKNIGYSSLGSPDDYGLSLVLGGAEVTLLEHVHSFTAFSQEGKIMKPISLLEIKDKHGSVIFKEPYEQPREIFNPEIARQISEILSDAQAREYVFGKNPYLSLRGRPSAIKTGTTNDYRDAWTIGYTPSLVTGVWVGNNKNTPMKKGADGSKVAAPIWSEFMNTVLKGTEVENFTKPLEIFTGKPILDGSLGEEKVMYIDTLTGAPAVDSTPLDRVKEQNIKSIHSILFYVDKNNPRGPLPQHPQLDPQFDIWEKGVQEWVKKHEVLQISPLKQSEISLPSLSIITPTENETITNKNLNVTINTSSSLEISRVEYFLDGVLLRSISIKPFSLEFPLIGVSNGFHTLLVKSYDKNGNSQSASMTLNFLLQ